jgi:hypothetical protein
MASKPQPHWYRRDSAPGDCSVDNAVGRNQVRSCVASAVADTDPLAVILFLTRSMNKGIATDDLVLSVEIARLFNVIAFIKEGRTC